MQGKKDYNLTTFCGEFGFCSSHSMSRGTDDENWWWHGKVALSPTTFFISVWAPTDRRLTRTEGEQEKERERKKLETEVETCQTGSLARSKLEARDRCCGQEAKPQ